MPHNALETAFNQRLFQGVYANLAVAQLNQGQADGKSIGKLAAGPYDDPVLVFRVQHPPDLRRTDRGRPYDGRDNTRGSHAGQTATGGLPDSRIVGDGRTDMTVYIYIKSHVHSTPIARRSPVACRAASIMARLCRACSPVTGISEPLASASNVAA